VRDRFVAELVSEGRPGCVIDASRHPGSGEFRGGHVADRDVVEASNQIERELVLEIGAGVRHLGVQIRDMPLVLSRALGFRQLFSRALTEAVVRQLFAGRKCGEVFQAEIDADAGMDRASLNVGHLNHDVQEPVATRILREVGSVLDLAFGKRATAEHAKGISCEAKCIALALQVAALQRYPAERFPAAIAQVGPTVLAARFRVLLARCVDGTGVDPEFLAATRGQHVQVKTRRPPLVPLERVLLRVVAEVPDVVHRTALLVKQSVERLYPVAVDKDHARHSNVGALSVNNAFFRFAKNCSVSWSIL